MSVLQLLGSAGDGGAETYYLALVQALAQDGLRQACAIRPHAGREARLQALGVPFVTAPFGGPLDFVSRGKVAALAKRHDAQALIAWMSRAARFSPKGPWARIGRLGGYYDLKYYRGFDALVGNTRDIQAWITRQGWPAERALYIPNFAEPGPEPAVDRTSLDTPADAPLFLALGRLHPAKAHDVALKALARLPEAWLWIAGSGPLEADLKALAAELGVAPRVRFLGWREDASALYRAADACLFPSRYEPLGNVVIQAWAHGLPVVAAASQGPKDLIAPGVDGLLAPIDDDEALAVAARRLIEEPALGARLAQAGAARVSGEFSRARVVAEWRTLLGRYGVA
ncbi:MAG TPA: glycosyltransferase [Caulobacteraceae bacterium]|nr:glycosyltransferase [Caulobacteraceae bacterium]